MGEALVDTPLLVSCSTCATAYRVRLGLVPERGARAVCRVCSEPIVILRPKRPTVWVFTDDPAMQRANTLPILEGLEGYEVLLIDAFERQALQDLPVFPTPEVVIFGDMHALLEDPVLARVAQEGAAKILLSTHENEELQEVVEAFCGFDHLLFLPIEPSLLHVVLEDATRRDEEDDQ